MANIGMKRFYRYVGDKMKENEKKILEGVVAAGLVILFLGMIIANAITPEPGNLRNPEDVITTIQKYDYNGDQKIELIDSGESSDGREEFAQWASDTGYDVTDSDELYQFFKKYDANGDLMWDQYEVDQLYTDYYNK